MRRLTNFNAVTCFTQAVLLSGFDEVKIAVQYAVTLEHCRQAVRRRQREMTVQEFLQKKTV